MTVRKCMPLVALAILAACSGNSNTSNALPSAPQATERSAASVTSATTPAPTPTPIHLDTGKTLGTPGRFSPAMGDSSSGGVNKKPVDGIPCGNMYDSNYHVHAFLGVLVNGKQFAIPSTIGMYEPSAPKGTFYPTANCVYQIHTHDSSGYIHLESPSSAPLSSSIFTLGNLLDIWGQKLTTTSFANFSGAVHIFYATTTLGNTNNGPYVAYTGSTPKSIKLYSHEAIWIEVGTYVPASQLPRIVFNIEH